MCSLSAVLLLAFVGCAVGLRPYPQLYNERLAKLMVPLVAAAYEEHPEICVGNRFKNATVVKRFEPRCDSVPTNNCSGYISLIHDHQVIALTFRGANTDKQVELSMLSVFRPKVDFLHLGGVGEYFHGAFSAVWNGGMESEFAALRLRYPHYRLWICGHSLGGVMASLATLVAVRDYEYSEFQIDAYAFGIPRIGDPAFADNYRRLVPNLFRITHSADFVADFPARQYNYEHHAREIWYNNTMLPGERYIICRHEDDPKCQRKVSKGWEDHKWYFTYLGGYARGKCRVPVL